MRQIVSSITESSAQQAQGVVEVNQSVGHIEGVTKQNADLVKQTRLCVEQMQSVSDQLKELMSRFKISKVSSGQLGHNEHLRVIEARSIAKFTRPESVVIESKPKSLKE
ncbi:hypothetical protein P8S54_01235 [Thiomicrospira sp. R3]|uniref:hypothetical protein n=1 Tax=Thiomicrospira sp. R3 TaxID=3035472 RepID=UPI00259B1597|nr:hypothetical protein [Thiomicrospira sp. R3]WFE68950.1 hypothetical protein P8S54_01235 [Thiomicrospira sp. R3]